MVRAAGELRGLLAFRQSNGVLWLWGGRVGGWAEVAGNGGEPPPSKDPRLTYRQRPAVLDTVAARPAGGRGHAQGKHGF